MFALPTTTMEMSLFRNEIEITVWQSTVTTASRTYSIFTRTGHLKIHLTAACYLQNFATQYKLCYGLKQIGAIFFRSEKFAAFEFSDHHNQLPPGVVCRCREGSLMHMGMGDVYAMALKYNQF